MEPQRRNLFCVPPHSIGPHTFHRISIHLALTPAEQAMQMLARTLLALATCAALLPSAGAFLGAPVPTVSSLRLLNSGADSIVFLQLEG